MNQEFIRNIIREEILSILNEEDIETTVFTPAEEKFLAKFVELGAQSLGIIYAPNDIGIREFLGRSGKDFNLTPDVLAKLLKDKVISIIPYGGYSRNEDYTLKLNIPLDELEGIGGEDAKDDTAGDDSAETPDDIPAPAPEVDAAPEPPLDAGGAPQESYASSKDIVDLLVSEAKKKSKSKVHTKKARTLKRLPAGYVLHLERIIQILSKKVHTKLEKEHLVADILDNLSHNFGLTPQQVYKSYIYYKSQNRLKNMIKDNND